MLTNSIYFITANKNKFEEFHSILGQNIKIKMLNMDLDEIQGSPQEIAIHKAKQATKVYNKTVIIEDTCLCFNALGGLPGPYIKWFQKSVGNNGLVSMLDSFQDKSAYALCTIAFCKPGQEPILFEGKTDGVIVCPRGNNGFGWDSVFKPNGYSQTFSEMDPFTKNGLSHRRKAIDKLLIYLQTACK